MPAESESQLIVAEPAGRYAVRSPLVVDCSVIAALLFDEPTRDAAALALAGRELHAPDLLAHELVSVAVKKTGRVPGEAVTQGLADFAVLDLVCSPVDPAAQWRLALECGVSAYDAAYLWLAVTLGAPLVTFDRSLGAAAERLLGPGLPMDR
jgi:predicted nucleic acid-binding protein